MQPTERGDSKFVCDYCPRLFKSARGRSQHKRSMHFEHYVNERSKKKIRDPGTRNKAMWSEEEVERLCSLSEVVPSSGDCADIAKRLGADKTREQIRNKYRLLYERPNKGRKAELAITKRRAKMREKLIIPQPNHIPVRGVKQTLKKMVKSGHYRKGDKILATGHGKLRISDSTVSPIEKAANALYLALGPKIKKNTGAKREGGLGSRPSSGRKSRIRVHSRKWYYDLLRSSRAKLAKFVLDKQLGTRCPVPLEEVTTIFKNRWGNGDPFHGLGQFISDGKIHNDAFDTLFTPWEVLTNLRAVASNTATGPDGISKGALQQWHPTGEKLAKMFSSWLVAGKIPRAFKECRTTLLPKTMDPEKLKDVNEWRPITIGSMVIRLFSRILTRRMSKASPLHPRQRGFIAAPGCSEYLMILKGVMKNGKIDGNTTAVVFIDFAKAFDTVSHKHMLTILKQKGMDEHVVNLIEDSYRECTTTVGCLEGTSSSIAMEVGVKQGDPMSPLLFNLAMDPLIQVLERDGQGLEIKGKTLTAMAFADDLAMLSNSWDGMVLNISILETFCDLTGMKIQPKKCHGFMISIMGKLFEVNNWRAQCGEYVKVPFTWLALESRSNTWGYRSTLG
ncbi:hypothetical protein VZT92_021173 [Zoarces viviparus]